MSTKKIKSQVNQNGKILHDTVSKITKLNKVLPALQQAIIFHDWFEENINKEPEFLATNIDENIVSIVTATYQALGELKNIPDISPYTSSDIIASGSAGTAVYFGYMTNNKERFSSNKEIQSWSDEGTKAYLILEQNSNQTSIVRKRLGKLNLKLVELHIKAEESTLSSIAGLEFSIASASALRELLDQFKGLLLDKCRGGQGATYQRIAQFLSIDTPIARIAIESNQDEYERLHKTLSRIIHSRLAVEPNLMISYFRQVEDHVKIVTDNLNPSVIGIDLLID
jgi:hypothetical protein